MDGFTNRDIASAIIRSGDGDFFVLSLYLLDIEFKPENATFMELVKECKKERLPLIVGMDSNDGQRTPMTGEGNLRKSSLNLIWWC